jgi:hypothetical protein
MDYALINFEAEKLLNVGTVTVPKGLTRPQCQDFWFAWAQNPAIVGYDPIHGAAVHLVAEIPDYLKKPSNQMLQSLVAQAMCTAALCQGWTAHARTYDQYQPREWKGRKSKEKTLVEIRAICGKKADKWTDHQVDAAALGLWFCRNAKQSFQNVA